MIGHPCGSSANAAGHIYATNSVVLLGITRHPALTEKRAGEVIFRVAGRDDRQGASAAAYFSRKFRDKPIAIVRDASRYARRIANDVLAAFKQAGFTEVLSAAVWGGQKDYSKLVAKLQAANIHALFFAGFPLEAGLLLRQLRSAGLSTVFVGTETLASAQFADTAGSAFAPWLAGVIAVRHSLHVAILVICISPWLLCAVLFGVTAWFIPRDVARLRRTMEERAEAERGAGVEV